MTKEFTKDVMETIKTKRAVRKFSDQRVPDEIMKTILNAGRVAQSSKNDQAWTFVVIRDKDTLAKLAKTGDYAGHLARADFAVALVGQPNAIEFDLGQAAANMQLAAWGYGVGSCIASIWEPDKGRDILDIPADHSFDIAISFGYPADGDQPKAQKTGRRPLEDVVKYERW
jgi:nitroreductase